MKLNCSQMEILISFYIENELSSSLKKQVEEHLFECKSCMSKYEIIKSAIDDLKSTFAEAHSFTKTNTGSQNPYSENSEQYKNFKTNLSAYVDNELDSEEAIKLKKYTINNLKAKKELENCYNLRKFMKNSLKKSKAENKSDYSKKIVKQLSPNEYDILGFHPAVNLLIAFTISVLVVSAIVLISLNI